MEGRVYVSSWRKTRDGYRVWVKNKPKLAAEGKTFLEADEALWHVIMRATDDGENTREYDPAVPAPAKIAAFLEPAIVRVLGNAWAVGVDPEGLFADGYCARCGAHRGARTDKPLAPADIGPEDGGQVTALSSPSYARARLHYFSERFLDLLKPKERNLFTWRRIARPSRAKKVYYELVASAVVVRPVAVKGLPLRSKTSGWHCKLCKFSVLPAYGPWEWPLRYVCSTDLPDPLPSCFAIGDGIELSLCLRQERWRQMVGKSSANGIVTDDIGVVPPDRCDRAPRLEREVSAIERAIKRMGGSLFKRLG